MDSRGFGSYIGERKAGGWVWTESGWQGYTPPGKRASWSMEGGGHRVFVSDPYVSPNVTHGPGIETQPKYLHEKYSGETAKIIEDAVKHFPQKVEPLLTKLRPYLAPEQRAPIAGILQRQVLNTPDARSFWTQFRQWLYSGTNSGVVARETGESWWYE
jgi:hypothetical protein